MKQTFNWLLGYWSRFASLLLPKRNKNQQKEKQSEEITEDVQGQLAFNLHYSIPGRAFTGSIDKGHVLKTDNKWPFTGN